MKTQNSNSNFANCTRSQSDVIKSELRIIDQINCHLHWFEITPLSKKSVGQNIVVVTFNYTTVTGLTMNRKMWLGPRGRIQYVTNNVEA